MTKHNTDLTDAQYKLLSSYLPPVKRTKPRVYTRHSILNGIMYVLKTGCQWRMLPECYPPFKLVHFYFRKLVVGYKLEKLICNLNKYLAKQLRNQIRAPDLVLIVDTKSVRTTEYFESRQVGRDGHKKIKGIKLCPVVDRLRRCWRVTGTPANQSEYIGVTRAIQQTVYSKVKPYARIVIGDRYYDSQKLRQECKLRFNLDFISLQRRPKRKFQTKEDEALRQYREGQKKRLINPIRYLVEQFFSHLEKARRLVVVYERKLNSYLGFVKLRVIQLLLKRILPELR